MLGRRHLRAKVMQAMYAYECSSEDMLVIEKNMFNGIDKIYDLYIYSINFLLEVRNLAETKLETRKKKNLATEEDLNPNRRFIDNKIFEFISKKSRSFFKSLFLSKSEMNEYSLLERYFLRSVILKFSLQNRT